MNQIPTQIAARNAVIPQALKEHRHWTSWFMSANGKQPAYLSGKEMKWGDPKNWYTFLQVAKHINVGIILVPSETGVLCIDADGCRDKGTGVIHPLVLSWCQGNYAEVSPSETGVKIFIRGVLPQGMKAIKETNVPWRTSPDQEHVGIEVYGDRHFFTITGNIVPGCPSEINEAPGVLSDILVRFAPPPKIKAEQPPEPATSGWDFDAWVNEHLDVIEVLDDGYIITCPWADEHSPGTGTTARIWKGEPKHTFNCFHNHCSERIWRDVRTFYEPDAYMWQENGHRPDDEADAPQERPDEGKRTVTLGRQLSEEIDDILDALYAANDPPVIFVRNGSLARISSDEKDRPHIEPMDEKILLSHICRAATFQRYVETRGRFAATHPAAKHASLILAKGRWDFPPLEAITGSPVIRPDGSILATPGYDPATHLYYAADPGLKVPPIPLHPTQEDAKKAAAYLLDFDKDFPFVEQADRANAMALDMTALVRHLVRHVPLAVITAPKAGGGKGLRTCKAALIATGRPAEVISEVRSDEEWDKRMTAILLGNSAAFINIDNVEGVLRSPILAAALTADVYTGRVLGLSKMAHVDQRATWVATGNNVQLGGDLPRRSYPIRIAVLVSNPWEREDIRDPDLLGTIAKERGRIIAAMLTMIRAWWIAGKPAPGQKVKRMATFSQWADLIGGVLAYAGINGFLANLPQMYEESDVDGKAWAIFLETWLQVLGKGEYTTSRLIEEWGKNSDLADTLPVNFGIKWAESCEFCG